jgi:hypothetical protein
MHRAPSQFDNDNEEVLFARLLKGFVATLNGDAESPASADSQGMRKLLDGYRLSRQEWEVKQQDLADDFNLFQVMQVEYDELRHSMILAWLLDRRIEHGTHAQGNLGFRLFLEEFGRDLGSDSRPQIATYCEDPSYWVRREVSCGESRVDIEIAARGKFIIHIENKIGAVEGEDQTHREWRGLRERARELGIAEASIHAVFLTLGGSKPQNDNFVRVGWSRMARILDKFAEQARPDKVKVFVEHYAETIRRLAVSDFVTEETENGNAIV